MIYSLGCDIAKDEHTTCLLRYNLTQQQWQVIGRKTFTNTPSGSKALVGWVRRLTKAQPGPIRCTMEATGVYYEQLALYLFDHHPEFHLSVILASQGKTYISSRGLRNKTDKIDAFGLALMGAERKLDKWKGIDRFWRVLRQMTRAKADLQDQITMVNNQLHALTHSGVQVKAVQASLNKVLQALRGEQDKLTRQITMHLASRKDLAGQIACLKSIPGIGMQTIAVILAETLGFAYFTSYGQLMSYSGYDVVANESAKRIGKRKISKQGSPYIRRAMYMPASTILRIKSKPLYGIYENLLAKHGIKMKAHVAIQKKLLGYMYILWNNQETFDPQNIIDRKKEFEAHKKRIEQSNIKKVALPIGKATVDTSQAKAS